jgi:hypothetical protein
LDKEVGMVAFAWLLVITKFIEGIAWPAVVLVIAWMFREKIGHVLSKIRQAKFPGVELTVDHAIQEATEVVFEAQVAKEQVEAPAEVTETDRESVAQGPQPTPVATTPAPSPNVEIIEVGSGLDSKAKAVAREAMRLAKTDTRAAMLSAWAAVETALERLGRTYEIQGTFPDVRGFTRSLEYLNVISGREVELYDRLREVSETVGRDERYVPSHSTVVSYIHLTTILISRFNRLIRARKRAKAANR